MRFLNKMAQLTVGYSQPDALIDYLKYGYVNPPSNFKFKYGCVYFLKVFKERNLRRLRPSFLYQQL